MAGEVNRKQQLMLNDKYPKHMTHVQRALAVTTPVNNFACSCGETLSPSFQEQHALSSSSSDSNSACVTAMAIDNWLSLLPKDIGTQVLDIDDDWIGGNISLRGSR